MPAIGTEGLPGSVEEALLCIRHLVESPFARPAIVLIVVDCGPVVVLVEQTVAGGLMLPARCPVRQRFGEERAEELDFLLVAGRAKPAPAVSP